MKVLEINGLVYLDDGSDVLKCAGDGTGEHLSLNRLDTIIRGRNRAKAPTPADILRLRGMSPELEEFWEGRQQPQPTA